MVPRRCNIICKWDSVNEYLMDFTYFRINYISVLTQLLADAIAMYCWMVHPAAASEHPSCQ